MRALARRHEVSPFASSTQFTQTPTDGPSWETAAGSLMVSRRQLDRLAHAISPAARHEVMFLPVILCTPAGNGISEDLTAELKAS
jgi:hypothetical protein